VQEKHVEQKESVNAANSREVVLADGLETIAHAKEPLADNTLGCPDQVENAVIVVGDGLPPIRSADELLADDTLVCPEEVVRGILHRGTKGVLAAPSKSGKSWVLKDLAISIATGNPWLNWTTVQGKVLYVNFEIMEPVLAKRIRAIKEAKTQVLGDLDFSNFHVETMRGSTIAFPDFIQKLINRLRGQNYALIIIDPFYKSMVGKDENKSSSVNPVCALLDRLAHETGAAVVVAHHFPKGWQGKKAVVDRIVGSGVIARDADTIVTLTEHPEPGCLTMEFVLRNFPNQNPVVIEPQVPLLIVRKDLDPAASSGVGEGKAADRSEALLGLVGPERLPATDWKARALSELGIPHATFYRAKKRLVEQGKVTLHQESGAWSKAE
jgi:hypothetical protein